MTRHNGWDTDSSLGDKTRGIRLYADVALWTITYFQVPSALDADELGCVFGGRARPGSITEDHLFIRNSGTELRRFLPNTGTIFKNTISSILVTHL